MAKVRFWQPADLPYLLLTAAKHAWEITPPDDKAASSMHTVALTTMNSVMGMLRSPGGTAVVAEENGRPAGYIILFIQRHDRTGEPQGYMADTFVEPEFRRRGISTAMHRKAEEYLRGLGLHKATTWVHAHNAGAWATAQHHGMKSWGMMLTKQLKPAVATKK